MEVKYEELHKAVKHAVEQGGDIRDVLYRLCKVNCDFFESDREFYMLMMSLFYSARENEAYQAVKPFVTEFYETIVEVFQKYAGLLGNMNGRERQFAIGFSGTVNHYLLLHSETDPDQKEKITDTQITSLVNQYMYGIFT